MIHKFWWVPIIAVGMAMAAHYAQAAPPDGYNPDSDTAKWYHSLRSPAGGLCCDLSDCRPVDARIVGDHWEAWADNKWYPIPDDKIVHASANPTGEAVLCHYSATIYCFVPGGGV